MRNLVRYLLESAVIGIAVAVAIVLFYPQLLKRDERAVVEVHHAHLDRRERAPASYADAVSRASPAVVNIYTRKQVEDRDTPLAEDPLFQRYFGGTPGKGKRRHAELSLGSGVLISPEGYLLTNDHVVRHADRIQVLLDDGRRLPAELIGRDRETDLAVLRIHADHLPRPAVVAPGPLRVGDVVLAIGNPYGVGKTVTMGIVSATGRSQLGINSIEDFIQTDAAINPGNSGGALVNALGELIGINSAIYSESGGSQGIGFAIPISLAQDVMTQIIEHGRVIRGWLGVEGQDLTRELAESFGLKIDTGVLIAGVVKDGPAHRAGLQPGDIITRLDGKPVASAREAFNRIARLSPGSTVHIEGLRGGRPFRADAVIAERPQAD
ncbi:MAG: PDZ domain-containing protein [Gammaproteobacteria bacterium]|nr:MAG: PDZ domain-containing protein [Gammaproteobacteria bacterium]